MDKVFYKNMSKFTTKYKSEVFKYITFDGNYAIASNGCSMARIKCTEPPHIESTNGQDVSNTKEFTFPPYKHFFSKENVMFNTRLSKQNIIDFKKIFGFASTFIQNNLNVVCIEKTGSCLILSFHTDDTMTRIKIMDDIDSDDDFVEFVNAKYMSNIFSFMKDMKTEECEWTIKKGHMHSFCSGYLDFVIAGIHVPEKDKYTEVF